MPEQLELYIPLCKCGCGQPTKWNTKFKRWNNYIQYHQKGSAPPIKYYREWIELYGQGYGTTTISKMCNTSRPRIMETLRKHGIVVNPDIRGLEPRETYHFFDQIDNEVKAYWLGFIYADGHITKGRYAMTIALSYKDKGHLEKMANIFGKTIKIYNNRIRDIGKVYKRCWLELQSKYLWRHLQAIGIPQRKSYIDSTKIFASIPNQLVNHFIRGYFDGDGSIGIYKYRNSSVFNTAIYGTVLFLGEIQKIVIRDAKTTNGSKFETKGTHVLKWSGGINACKIADYLYKDATVYLERKREIFDKIKEFYACSG